MSAWICLGVAGVLEIVWAVGLKSSEHTARWSVPGWLTILAMILSFGLLSEALKTIPIGTAYAVWTGIGIVGTAVLGVVVFGESKDALRLGCIAMILIGIIGLKFTAR